ncbi:MAG: hypothetical protein WA129_09845, partial [Acidovorax sp.]
MAQDIPLMRALGLAHHWQRLLDEGRFSSMTEIAAAEGIDLGQASKMSRLAQLAPDLIEAIALGRLQVGVSQLLRGKLSASWLAQREALVAGSCPESRRRRGEAGIQLLPHALYGEARHHRQHLEQPVARRAGLGRLQQAPAVGGHETDHFNDPKSGSYPVNASGSGGSQGGNGRVIFATT